VMDVLNDDLDMTLALSLLEAAGLEALASDPSANLTLLVPTNQAILDGLNFFNLTLAAAQSQQGEEAANPLIRYKSCVSQGLTSHKGLGFPRVFVSHGLTSHIG
jgi:hypothetical protein